MKTVIVGLGNSILSDDAVGLVVARRASERIRPGEPIEVAENERGGMDVVDLILPYERAVVVDAIRTRSHPVGSLFLLKPEHLPATRRLCGMHDLDLLTSLDLARRLDVRVPSLVAILAVEILDDMNFSERLTAEVEEAVPRAVDTVLEMARGTLWPKDRPETILPDHDPRPERGNKGATDV